MLPAALSLGAPPTLFAMLPNISSDAAATVIIVSYDSVGDLLTAASSVPEAAELIVVEQHPGSEALRGLLHARPGTIIVQAGANRGFGAGCNLGAANASRQVLVFLNPDAALVAGALATLVSRARDPGVGLVGPEICGSDGDVSTRARNWSGVLLDALHLVLPTPLMPRTWNRDIPPDDPRYRDGSPVPYVQGSCMAIDRDAFWEVGGFDERFFLFGEEEDLARRLLSTGRTSRVESAARALHKGHTSTVTVASFAVEQLFRSQILIYRLHRGPLRAGLGAFCTSAALALLLVTAPVRRFTPFRQLETAEWCRAALRGVRAGWAERPVQPPVAEFRTAWEPPS